MRRCRERSVRPRQARRDAAYTSFVASRPRTIRLTPGFYDRLKEEARRRGTEPDVLAEELLRADLGGEADGNLDSALAGLAELRARLPEIDGLALAHEARRELENRDA